MYIDEFLALLDKAQTIGGKHKARCPAHDDKTPSLSIKQADDKILLYCHAGCSALDVVSSLGLELSDLYLDSNMTPQQKRTYAKKKNKYDLAKIIWRELFVLMKFFDTRFCDQAKLDDSNYLEQHPEFKPMPTEPWDRELIAQKRLIDSLGEYYG